jgi:biopolymer transport protein ExbB/TolQ
MPFLGPLSFIQKILGSVGLAVILSLSLALFFADRRADKWERQAVKANAELQRISTEKDEQAKETGRNINSARERIVYVDRIAREIEKAPLPGQCATPPIIMGADL